MTVCYCFSAPVKGCPTHDPGSGPTAAERNVPVVSTKWPWGYDELISPSDDEDFAKFVKDLGISFKGVALPYRQTDPLDELYKEEK